MTGKHYYWEIMLPGSFLEIIVGYATQVYAGARGRPREGDTKDVHVHAGRIRIVNGERLGEEWEFYGNGQRQSSGRFLLRRKGSRVSLPTE